MSYTCKCLFIRILNVLSICVMGIRWFWCLLFTEWVFAIWWCLVLEQMADQILHQEVFVHSYPHDWRSKQPLIIRASEQWFVDTNRLRDKSLVCHVNWELCISFFYFFLFTLWLVASCGMNFQLEYPELLYITSLVYKIMWYPKYLDGACSQKVHQV